MDAAGFRAAFPPFANVTTYPDTQVNFWLGIAGQVVNPDRWGGLTDFGKGLFVAHNLVLEARSAKAAAIGGAPGGATGVMTGKTVDKVSATYDASTATEEGAGNWNATDYGTRYWRFSLMMGAGGLQL
jgi:hypothetical protein